MPVHGFVRMKGGKEKCFLLQHSEAFFGLAKSDHVGSQKWKKPTVTSKKRNAADISQMRAGEDGGGSGGGDGGGGGGAGGGGVQ